MEAVSKEYQVNLGIGIWKLNWNFEGMEEIVIRGNGSSTIIQPLDIIGPALKFTNCKNVVIKNLAIDGLWQEGATSDPTYFRNIEDLKIENVSFFNCYHRAINIPSGEPSRIIRVKGCHFQTMHRDAIYIGHSQDVFITENIIEDSPDVAIDIGERVANISVTNNIIKSAVTGIMVSREPNSGRLMERIIIANNILSDVLASGIEISATPGAGEEGEYLIQGNYIKSSPTGAFAIRVEAGNGLIANNKIVGFVGDVIMVEAPRVKVQGNQVSGEGNGHCVYVIAPDVQVCDNSFHLPGSPGIYSNGDRTIVASNEFCDVERAVEINGASFCRVTGNTTHRITGGVFLIDSDHCVVDGNVMFDSLNNNDVKEEGTADYNRIRRNLVRNKYSVQVVGANTIAEQNDWF